MRMSNNATEVAPVIMRMSETWFNTKIPDLIGIGIPIMEIRRSPDRLISTMGISMPIRCHYYIESNPPGLGWVGDQTLAGLFSPYAARPQVIRCTPPSLTHVPCRDMSAGRPHHPHQPVLHRPTDPTHIYHNYLESLAQRWRRSRP